MKSKNYKLKSFFMKKSIPVSSLSISQLMLIVTFLLPALHWGQNMTTADNVVETNRLRKVETLRSNEAAYKYFNSTVAKKEINNGRVRNQSNNITAKVIYTDVISISQAQSIKNKGNIRALVINIDSPEQITQDLLNTIGNAFTSAEYVSFNLNFEPTRSHIQNIERLTQSLETIKFFYQYNKPS